MAREDPNHQHAYYIALRMGKVTDKDRTIARENPKSPFACGLRHNYDFVRISADSFIGMIFKSILAPLRRG